MAACITHVGAPRTQVRIVRDPTGKSRGFGFVAMETEEDVQRVRLAACTPCTRQPRF